MTSLRLPVALITLTLTAACITHLPPQGHQHMQVRWAQSFEAATREAVASNKPILACLIAGEIDGLC